MKTYKFTWALLVAALLFSTQLFAETSEAYTSGINAGKAIKGLYTEYKSAGKVEMTNLTNVNNMSLLSSSYKNLKGAAKDTAAYTDFTKGLMSGSQELVNANNTGSVMDQLSGVVSSIDASNSSSGLSKTAKAQKAANSVTSLLKLLK